MEDVARRAGVSLATVSRVIHSQAKVRPATRQRVEEAMSDLGYVYNSMAADFTRQRNSMIGLIIFTVKSSIHAQLPKSVTINGRLEQPRVRAISALPPGASWSTLTMR